MMAALSAALMGTISLISRLSEITATSLTFYRLGIGALILGLFLLFSGKKRLLFCMPHWGTLIAGTCLAGFIVSFLKAIETIPISFTIMLVYLAPALAALIAHCVFAERLTKAALLLVLMAFFGFAMVQEFSLDINLEKRTGLYWALVCLTSYTLFILVNKQVPITHHPYQKTFYQLFVGALCVLPFMANEPVATIAQMPWLFAAGVFPGFLAILFAVKSISVLPTRIFGTFAYIEPVVVILIGYGVFYEPMTLLQWAGCFVIITCGIGQVWLTKHVPQK